MARRSLIVALGVISALAAFRPGRPLRRRPPPRRCSRARRSRPWSASSWTPGERRSTRRSRSSAATGRARRRSAAGQIQPGSPYRGQHDRRLHRQRGRRRLLLLHPGRRPPRDGQQPGADGDRRHARPGGDHRHPERSAAGVVSGTVTISSTSADAASGVATSVQHIGATGACPSGPVMGSTWDTTGVGNGLYDVCNVVADNAGHVAVATITVTVAKPRPHRPPCRRRPRGRHEGARRADEAQRDRSRARSRARRRRA